MKQLAVLRHAKSSWDQPQPDDFDRPLSKRGREAAKAMGRALAERGFSFDVVLASTALRVRQTIDALGEKLLRKTPVRFEADIYLAGEDELLALVRGLPETVHRPLLVGHNPGLERLLAKLARNENDRLLERVREKFPTAAFALVDLPARLWDRIEPGSGRIAQLILPREID